MFSTNCMNNFFICSYYKVSTVFYKQSLIAPSIIAFSVIIIAMLQATGSEGAAQQSRTGTMTAHPCLTLPALTPEGIAYIRRRNERERERVRCVNDHYECLRRHIPHHFLQAAYGDSQALEERGVSTHIFRTCS